MSDPKNHHYVPRMYLRSFASGVGRRASLVAVETESGRILRPRLRRVASEKDFNRVDIDGEDPYAVEKALSAAEGEIAPALNEVTAAGTFPTTEHRNLVLNLIAMLAVRNPRVRGKLDKFMSDIHRASVEVMLGTRERWEAMKKQAEAENGQHLPDVDYDDAKQAFLAGDIKIRTPKTDLIGMDLDMIDPALSALNLREWEFISAAEGNQFITSDDPVCLDFYDQTPPSILNHPGFGLPGTFVFFALSPRLALYGPLEAPSLPDTLDVAQTAGMNGLSMRHARRHAFARDEDFTVRAGDGTMLSPIELRDYLAARR